MSKPNNKDTSRPKPFFKDQKVELTTLRDGPRIIGFRSRLVTTNEVKDFIVKGFDIVKAFQNFETYLNKKLK